MSGSVVRPTESPPPVPATEEEQEQEQEDEDEEQQQQKEAATVPEEKKKETVDTRQIITIQVLGFCVATLALSVLVLLFLWFLPRCSGGGGAGTVRAPLALHRQHHNTQSESWTVAHAASMLGPLSRSFAIHLRDEYPALSCVCAHHLLIPERANVRLCAVRNDRNWERPVLMANPAVTALAVGAADVVVFLENSVACRTPPKQRERSRQVMVAWEDPLTQARWSGTFSGVEAACLQLALDEMRGADHC